MRIIRELNNNMLLCNSLINLILKIKFIRELNNNKVKFENLFEFENLFVAV